MIVFFSGEILWWILSPWYTLRNGVIGKSVWYGVEYIVMYFTEKKYKLAQHDYIERW